MRLRKLLIVLSLSTSLVIGCASSNNNTTKEDTSGIKEQWGNVGECPTAVWTDYSWEISARED